MDSRTERRYVPSYLRFERGFDLGWSVVFLVAGTVFLACVWVWLRPLPAEGLLLGALAGAIVGRLESRAVSENPQRFAEAEDAKARRRLLRSTAVGRAAAGLRWGSVVGLFVLGAVRRDLNTILLGNFALEFFRELFSLGARRRVLGGGRS